MESITKIFSNLPLDKLTPNGVLTVAIILLIVIGVITFINRKAHKIHIEDKGSKIVGLKAGIVENSNKNKSIKIKLENSNIRNSEIGCIKNDTNKD
ncbi:hypothetical protein [Candidatus Clostridium radicumherbarum]|uniref:Preprotein translocase subunit YajC n=1 Tax=Candidatus Clostridium radicumherbarum TaxID=3381662 RepID=A0ABW8TPE4_9CLOT